MFVVEKVFRGFFGSLSTGFFSNKVDPSWTEHGLGSGISFGAKKSKSVLILSGSSFGFA
jgi:hypothetical protein